MKQTRHRLSQLTALLPLQAAVLRQFWHQKQLPLLIKICPTAQQQLAESGPDFGRTLKSDGSLDGGLSPGPSQQNDSYQHSNPQFA
uniref:Secreted protein n=1 Tax=Macrostomum lignano TaxID=282301 RepID=A0A1I8GL27_9PLAT